jgi:hypothetical protein
MTGFSIALEARNPGCGHFRAHLVAAPGPVRRRAGRSHFGRIGSGWSKPLRPDRPHRPHQPYAAGDEAEARRIAIYGGGVA